MSIGRLGAATLWVLASCSSPSSEPNPEPVSKAAAPVETERGKSKPADPPPAPEPKATPPAGGESVLTAVTEQLRLSRTGIRGAFAVEESLEGTGVATSGSVIVRCNDCRFVPAEAEAPYAGSPEIWSHLPELELGSWTLKLTIANGEITTAEPLQIESADLRVEFEGSLALREPLEKSRLDARIRVVFAEAAIDDDERLRFIVATTKKSFQIPPPGRGIGARLLGPFERLRAIGLTKP